ncbi:AAA family ATPase [Paenalkalicoccus suaedae]|uniref:AAA family ATPase n=1 Tax=Paenalkalicoccus suaedae TaxID=2592382 RepID=A0A859FFH6_9BACI|nr:AAA family ATPase [Paenalkalicoccus suaedae]QKS71354.1 AAA family ATPase [Paenalkalicoccus suaedae]
MAKERLKGRISFTIEKEKQVSKELASLATFVGLADMKRYLERLYASLQIDKERTNAKLPALTKARHMMFIGNPGTGKTSVARELATIFYKIGYIKENKLIEVSRSDLVGEYVGHTAQRMKQCVTQALGGILFIDEAYALSRGGEKDFGREAVDTLVKLMEDYKDELIVILAGYPVEMGQLLQTNAGLTSRIGEIIPFDDFTNKELYQIFMSRLDQASLVGENIESVFMRELAILHSKDNSIPNGRFIRSLFDHVVRAQSVRLLREENRTTRDLTRILPQDMRRAFADMEFKSRREQDYYRQRNRTHS